MWPHDRRSVGNARGRALPIGSAVALFWFVVRVATAATASAVAREPATPSGEGAAHNRVVERRADDPIFHRKVDRHAVPVWRVDAPRPLPPDAANIAGSTLISMHGEPGDYIGGNQTYLYTPSNGTFSIS